MQKVELLKDDSGAVTVEYAMSMVIAAVVAMGFLALVKGAWLYEKLQGLIQGALAGLG